MTKLTDNQKSIAAYEAALSSSRMMRITGYACAAFCILGSVYALCFTQLPGALALDITLVLISIGLNAMWFFDAPITTLVVAENDYSRHAAIIDRKIAQTARIEQTEGNVLLLNKDERQLHHLDVRQEKFYQRSAPLYRIILTVNQEYNSKCQPSLNF